MDDAAKRRQRMVWKEQHLRQMRERESVREPEKRLRVPGDVDAMIRDAYERRAADHAEAIESMFDEARADVRQLRKPDSEIDADLERMGF